MEADMRILAALMGIWVAASTSCSAEEVSHYVRKLGPESPIIVFLHGVLGDSKDTWTNARTKAYWPDLLKEDDTFSGASIFVHDYNTEMFARGSLSIDELARQLRIVLDANGVTQHRSLIFVAHSMGGLVVRDFLIKYHDAADKTRFILLLATPTTGATIANWATLVSDSPQFTGMLRVRGADTSFLTSIRDNWFAAGLEKKISSYCAYEKKEIKRGWFVWVLVVDQTSATSLCNTEPVAVQADHEEIAKPDSRTAIQYLTMQTAFKIEASKWKQELIKRGYDNLGKGQLDQAIEDFSEAINIDPQYPPAFKNRGATYLNKGAYVQAIQDFNKAIDLEPGYAEHFYNLGAAYFGDREYDRAIEDFTTAIHLNFYDSALTLYARGVAKQCKGEGGKVDMDEASRIDSEVVHRTKAGFFVCKQ
jgi:Tfp pilus assembly protein PilF